MQCADSESAWLLSMRVIGNAGAACGVLPRELSASVIWSTHWALLELATALTQLSGSLLAVLGPA